MPSRALVGVFALALVASGCAKSKPKTLIEVGGNLGFNQSQAVNVNGPISKGNVAVSCGASDTTFGTELINTSPLHAKVLREWADVYQDRQMFVAGRIANIEFSSGDLIFDHPFNVDFTFDVRPDQPYAALVQSLGAGAAEGGAAGTLHMEIEQGLIPHSDAANLLNFLPGFIPSVGDRVAVYGRFIIDCGHDDFHTEIHPITFMAFSHTEGRSTVVHVFYNPYYETQLYTPDPTLSNQVTNDARLTDPNTRTFPGYLVQNLLRIAHLGPKGPFCCADRLEAHILEGANTQSLIPWYVCPPGSSSGTPNVSFHLVTRPGVKVSESTASNGCASFTTKLTSQYQPVNPPRKDCVDPWDELTAQAEAATGNPNLDIKKLIEAQVPASFAPAVERDPVVDCYDPLTAPDPGAIGSGRNAQTSASQPFPLYGWVRVSRSS